MTFEEFFRAVHGYAPFPWQSEAARRLKAGKPLSAITVPTACGKTALIDAAIYAAAYRGRRRIAYIIDRRVVVDEAFLRAQRIADALQNTTDPNFRDFANRLGPVQVIRLRGGVHGDEDWVLYPDRVTVLVSTVDQVGSRLLHRGYGVSSRAAPLHAGFVGTDALYLIDEAHLSTCFLTTVRAAIGYGADIHVIPMTATPFENGDGLSLSDEDRRHPVLQQRLGASKPAQLWVASGGEADFCKTLLEAAQRLAAEASVIGIVVNRVATARRLWQLLMASKHTAVLLTGRARPYDRDILMDQLFPRIRAGRDMAETSPLFVVATQAIEVGADLDFDALVTEAAPLDALRQRFGRLDRLGKRQRSAAIIVSRPPQGASDKTAPDPIYGMAIHETWAWLQQVAKEGVVDFGVNALRDLIAAHPPPQPALPCPPAFLPIHLELLSQTGPESPEIDVAPWLHGSEPSVADVTLIWRADLLPNREDLWTDTLRLRPPLNQEAMDVPLYAARAWLQQRRIPDVTDLEGIGQASTNLEKTGRPVLRWRGVEDCTVITPQETRPGDTLVIPALYGGADRYGWHPDSSDPVEDVADFCALASGRARTVRLVPGLTGWLDEREDALLAAAAEVVAAETTLDPETGVDEMAIQAAHETLRAELLTIDHPLVQGLGEIYTIERHPSEAGVVLRGRALDEVAASLNGGVAITLETHLIRVGDRALELAATHPERERIGKAARHHDRGKAEPRFQAMLHGDPIAAAAGPVLAKSGLRRVDDLRAAYAQSGLPAGFRHELASLAFLEETDRLIRYLIASHHGYGRPWFPACTDPTAPGVAFTFLGSGWSEVFTTLRDHYGPWVLAEMELLVRAADARQSMAEQERHRD